MIKKKNTCQSLSKSRKKCSWSGSIYFHSNADPGSASNEMDPKHWCLNQTRNDISTILLLKIRPNLHFY